MVVSSSPILSDSSRITDHTAHPGLSAQWQIKSDKFLIVLHQLKRFGARSHFLGDAVELIIKYVAEPLDENQRQDEFLVFAASLAPRMEHAASQIHVSSDLLLPFEPAEPFSDF